MWKPLSLRCNLWTRPGTASGVSILWSSVYAEWRRWSTRRESIFSVHVSLWPFTHYFSVPVPLLIDIGDLLYLISRIKSALVANNSDRLANRRVEDGSWETHCGTDGKCSYALCFPSTHKRIAFPLGNSVNATSAQHRTLAQVSIDPNTFLIVVFFVKVHWPF